MGRFQVRLAAGLLGAVALFALPTGAQAQGYGLYEHNACAMARAGTGVASPCGDGSAMFFNPAGLTDISGKVGSLGGVLINTSGSFTADQNGAVTNLKDGHYPAPNAYLAANVGDGYAIGLGLFAPYGLTTEWPTNGAGRFLGYRSKIQAIYLQPTIALKITDNLSIGGGPDINFLSLQLYQHLDLAAQTVPGQAFTFASLGIPQGTDFADAKLSGSGTGFGYHFGVQWKVTDKISLGARYLGRQRVWINSATAAISQLPTGIILAAGNPFGVPAGTPLDSVVAPSFRGSGPLQNQGGKTMLRMPDQLVVGTAVKVTPKLTGLFDVQWTNWTVFDSIPLSFDRLPGKALIEHYQAVFDFRLGAEYALMPTTTLRAGVLAHKAAAPDQSVTPNLPEGPRTEFTVGAGTRLTDQLGLDVAFQYIDQADRRGRSTDGGLAVPTTAQNDGLYAFKAYLVGASLVYRF